MIVGKLKNKDAKICLIQFNVNCLDSECILYLSKNSGKTLHLVTEKCVHTGNPNMEICADTKLVTFSDFSRVQLF